MAKLRKRGRFWWMDFKFRGVRYQESTFLTNKQAAESYAAAYRTNLVNRRVGLVEAEPAPILKDFLEGPFLAFVKQQSKAENSRKAYEHNIDILSKYAPFGSTRLDSITDLLIQGYKEYRQGKKLSPATINSELRTLRKALRFAERLKIIHYTPITQLPGETNREFIADGETEKRYLELAEYPLKQIAILMLDLGLRPEEAVSLRKTDILDGVMVRQGKTKNAHRTLPNTARTIEVFVLCNALFPESPWVFPGLKGKHRSANHISTLHHKFCLANNFPEEFVLYAFRHTFGTRLAESGASVFDIRYLMGHSSVRVSEKYVHIGPSHAALAMRQKELFDMAIRGEASVTTESTTSIKKPSN